MPALFWLIVVGLAVATAAAVAVPSMRHAAEAQAGGRLDPTDPAGEPARTPWPSWLGPGVLVAAGLVVSLLLMLFVPGLGGLVLFIPLMLLGRWRRRPPGPRGPGAGGPPNW